MTKSDLTEHTVQQQELLRGKLLHVFCDQVRLPDGQSATREYIRHPGAVMIIPLLSEAGMASELVLERQYRYPVRATLIEFPAGKLDPGEDALACAQRELREETGYRARQWARAGALQPAVGYSDEVIEIWFARDLRAGARHLDQGEHLEVFSATAQQLLQWSREGRITDGKTLAGLFWVQNVLEQGWALQWTDAPGESLANA